MQKTAMALMVMILTAIVAVAGTGFPSAKSAQKTFKTNDAVGKNTIAFVSDAPMEKINGTADNLTGSFTLNPADLESTKGKLSVKVRDMKTAITKRDDHMYSAMWLDADAHPTVTYEITGLKDIKVSMKDGRKVATATATGNFTIHGVTKPLSAKVEITYLDESADTKKRASGDLVMVTATFDVVLKDHKIAGKEGVVGKSVGETIQVTASVFANS
jgi:polyisoprenoid-binding protein YceI